MSLATVWAAAPLQVIPFESVLAIICGFVVAALIVFVVVAVWMYRDAESRRMSGGLWVVLLLVASFLASFIGGIIVLVIYLIVRSDHPVGYGRYAGYPGYPPPYAAPSYPPAPAAPPPPVSAGVCRNCGAPLEPGGSFCVRCGARN